MRPQSLNKLTTAFVFLIVILATAATTMGIFSNDGTGQYEYKSIRGKMVTIYGKGLYKDMSAEVAPQGIAQDYITLFVGIPLLIISFFMARKGLLKGKYLLAGTLAYFLVTYLFYTVMGMYNRMFLAYVILTGFSFYAFILQLISVDVNGLWRWFRTSTPVKWTGRFLIFNSVSIALLWLSIVVPPLLNGTIVPEQAEHYTTLIVQGLDLGILLPAAFISGILFIRQKPYGYLLAPVYFVFLSLLMTALTAKVVAMKILGYNAIPVIFIIPAFNLITLVCTIIILNNIKENGLFNEQYSYQKETFIRFTLGFLLVLLALNAFGGGYYGMAGAENVPMEWLKGSPFRNYFIPSLILFICVGGSALIAAIAVFKQYHTARKAAFICGIITLLWLTVQVAIIGYVSWMQPTTAVAAFIILFLTWQLPKYEH